MTFSRYLIRPLLILLVYFALLENTWGQDNMLAKIDSVFRDAKEAKADIYCPYLLSLASQCLEKYKTNLASGKNKEEMAVKAMGFYSQAAQTAKLMSTKLGDLMAVKEYGISIQAQKEDEDNWARGEKNLDKTVEAFQNKKQEEAQVLAKTANTYYVLAVTNTLKIQKLVPYRQQLEQAEKTGTTKLAPISFQRLLVMIDRASAQIDQDKKDTPEVQEYIRQADKESRHAAGVIAWINQIEAKKTSLEQIRLSEEERIQRMASRFDLVLDFDADLALAVETLIQRMAELSQAKEADQLTLAEKEKLTQEQAKQIESQQKEIKMISVLRDSLMGNARKTAPLMDDWTLIQNELQEANQFASYEPERAIIRVPCSVLFKDSKNIDSKEFPRLMRIQQVLKKLPHCVFTIEGHTDGEGTEQANQSLSLAQAQVIRDFFIADGVSDPNRYIAIGFGESKPCVGGDNAKDRKQNARIDVVIQRQK